MGLIREGDVRNYEHWLVEEKGLRWVLVVL